MTTSQEQVCYVCLYFNVSITYSRKNVRALQAWQQVFHNRKQQTAGANDREDDQYDGDSNGDSGSENTDDDYDGDDQDKSRHSTEITLMFTMFARPQKQIIPIIYRGR
jgi:hypothetical protein